VLGERPRLSVVDVLASLTGGRVQVSIGGTEQPATADTTQPLLAGGRYVLQVARTPTGLVLTPPPDGPALSTEIATAILRQPAPELGAALEPLQTELAALVNPQPGTTQAPVPATVRAAATAASETLQTFVPSEPRPPNATELQNLVENGGQLFEAKLARLVENQPAPANALTRTATDQPGANKPTADQPTPDRTANPTARALGPDLKGDLLRLLQAVRDLGGTVSAPAAEGALRGIEAQQAAQSLAQENGSSYYLQIPFPDGGSWRTLHLGLEQQARPDDPDAEQPGRFRVFMHVPLTDLGETWIDAGLSGDRFRATIYIDRPEVLTRVQAALRDLRTELQNDGFSEVLLDVRPASALPTERRRETGALTAGRPDTVSVLDVRV
jgi:hypothetical protein